MLDYGSRGVLLGMDLDEDVKKIELLLQKQSVFEDKSTAASKWSRKYTQEVFEEAIKELIV
jgi:hypothetical protein